MPHFGGAELRMRVNKDNQRKIYVNPINYTGHTLGRLCSGVALQPRLGLLSKRWNRNDTAHSASALVVGCDLAFAREGGAHLTDTVTSRAGRWVGRAVLTAPWS